MNGYGTREPDTQATTKRAKAAINVHCVVVCLACVLLAFQAGAQCNTESDIELDWGVYRDSAASMLLDDWPVTSTNLRSPKYIFGKEDDIYIQVIGPAGYGNNWLSAKVSSESDPSGTIIVNLREVGGGVYQNTAVDSELLRLSDASAEGAPADTIKVIEEEVLSFELMTNNTVLTRGLCKLSVMVDRGEFATATARSYDYLVPPYGSHGPDRTPIWKVAADEFAADIVDWWEGDLKWWDVGNIRGAYTGDNVSFKDFLVNAGENQPNNGESDLFYAHSHGWYDGSLSGTKPVTASPPPFDEEYETIIADPSISLASSWNKDADWAIVKACAILCHTNVGRAKWTCALKNSRRAHGILSFEDPSASDYDGYVDDFLDEIGDRHTVISSWINGNTGILVADQPYGIVYHTENAKDVFQEPVEGISLTPDVTTDNFSYFWRDASFATGTDVPIDVSVDRRTVEVEWRRKRVRLGIAVHNRTLGVNRLVVGVHRFNVDRMKAGFDHIHEWPSGYIRISRNVNLHAGAISLSEAQRILSDFRVEKHLPSDAIIRFTSPIMTSDESSSPGKVIGYVFCLVHRAGGVEMTGDVIKVLVQADGVKLFCGYWHDFERLSTEVPRPTPFRANDLQTAIDWLSSKYRGLREIPTVSNIYPAYYLGGTASNATGWPRLVWHVQFTNGLYVLLDAKDNNIVDYFEHDRELRRRKR